MIKALLLFGAFTIFIFCASAQETEVPASEIDSVASSVEQEGIIIAGTVKRKEVNPLAPSKAAFYSAILPGLGQAYNKRYWKIPIVWGALGLGIYAYTFNNNEYNRFRDAFKRRKAGFTDDEFYPNNNGQIVPGSPFVSDDALQNAQERAQTDRDLALAITIGLYVLNIVDANVDAHLKQFNVDQNLSMDIKPYLEYNPITTDPQYGLAIIVKF
ncbi:MAG: DUF5683 domain-containing protein [Flavobacteriaceae bacterium]